MMKAAPNCCVESGLIYSRSDSLSSRRIKTLCVTATKCVTIVTTRDEILLKKSSRERKEGPQQQARWAPASSLTVFHLLMPRSQQTKETTESSGRAGGHGLHQIVLNVFFSTVPLIKTCTSNLRCLGPTLCSVFFWTPKYIENQLRSHRKVGKTGTFFSFFAFMPRLPPAFLALNFYREAVPFLVNVPRRSLVLTRAFLSFVRFHRHKVAK